MKTKTNKSFDTVYSFTAIKEKLSAEMARMTLEEQKEFMQKSGKVKSNRFNH
jgi:hypothetical protein